MENDTDKFPVVPDYQALIYEALLRIEVLLARDGDARPVGVGNKATMTVNEAARCLGVGRSKLYELVRMNKLRALRIGRRVLIPTRELDSYIDNRGC